ncbi:MAG: DNA recombination protein RmuC [Burkholderiales bacterium]
MTEVLPWLTFACAAAALVVGIVLLRSRGEAGRSERVLREELGAARAEAQASARELRAELSAGVERTEKSMLAQLTAVATVQNSQIDGFARQLVEVRAAIESRLDAIRRENTEQLEKMRHTVDEKLQSTLEKRLGESFKQVSDRLEAVYKGLGEMQTLAAGVGDLKRVLTNVKSRGTWGEVQLEALLEQTLTREQYEKNVATRPGSRERVEFAIRLPGREAQGQVWLPVDSKFPVEDYERLVNAAERADSQAVEEAAKALEARIRLEARAIHDKYIDPPATTDFAILFLPTEGLYAEVLRRPGLADALQRDFRVSIAGPTTFSALLNSLQMGFRTLAIEKRSSEVWLVLGAVKTEFAKFGDVLAAAKKQLQSVTNSIEAAEVRTRAMDRRLKDVEAMPEPEARGLLGDDRTP